MANWQAPSSHNAGDRRRVIASYARPYLDAVTGRVLWWTDTDDLPVGATPLFVVERAGDGRRVFSTDATDERAPLLFGTRILFR